MGTYQDFVERIKRELTMDDLVPGHTGRKPICCPLPGHSDKHGSFLVYRETNSWWCPSHPSTPSGGSPIDFVMAEQGVSFKEAVTLCARRAGIEMRPPTEEEKVESQARRKREDVLTALAQVTHGWLLGDSQTAIRTREYLLGRGFSDELMREQRLGLLDIQKLFQIRASSPILAGFSEADFAAAGLRNERSNALFLGPRLAIPLLDHQRVTGFTFRTLDPTDKRKYMHLPGPAGLYNVDALHHRSQEVLVNEGIPDCWTALQFGHQAVACLGVEATKHAALFRGQRRVILIWDNDAAGRGRVLKSARAIQAAMPEGEVCILHVPGAKDLNDWAQAGGTSEAFDELLRRAPDLIEYQIALLPDVKSGQRMTHDAQEITREILDSIAGMDAPLRAAYLKTISTRLATPVQDLRDMLKARMSQQKEMPRGEPRPDPASTPLKVNFEDTTPYVAALGFDFTQQPTANIGVWLRLEGSEDRQPCVVESVIENGVPKVSIVRYADRSTQERGKIRFPNPDLPRWAQLGTTPHSMERLVADPAANTPNTAELFHGIRRLLRKFIWFPARHEYDIVALWIMMTYVYPLFGTVGYLHFNGGSGSGKSLSLRFIQSLAFNALKTANISDSALFRSVDANRSTLLMDEAEKLSFPKPGTLEAATRSMFLDSYTEGALVYRMNMETNQVEAFDAFSPKCLGSINKIDPVFGNRCLTIHCLKKQKDAQVMDAAQNTAEVKRCTGEKRNELHCWALTKFHLIDQIYTVQLNGALPDLVSREREIWLNLISIAHLVDQESNGDETDSLVDVVLKAQAEKELEREEEARRENLDILVLQSLLNLITGEERKSHSLLMEPSKFIAQKLADTIHTELVEDGVWPFEKKLTSNRLTSTLKTHHVIAETDISRPMDGGKRVRAILLREQSLRVALQRLHGLDPEAEDGSAPIVPAAGPGPAGTPTQTTIHDNDPLPF